MHAVAGPHVSGVADMMVAMSPTASRDLLLGDLDEEQRAALAAYLLDRFSD